MSPDKKLVNGYPFSSDNLPADCPSSCVTSLPLERHTAKPAGTQTGYSIHRAYLFVGLHIRITQVSMKSLEYKIESA